MSESGYQNLTVENWEELAKAFQKQGTEYADFQSEHFAFKRSAEGTIHDLRKQLKERDRVIREQNKKIAALEKNLSKYEKIEETCVPEPKKNSENSGIPTSKEDIPSQIKHRTKTLRQPTGKKPGAQEGHFSSTLTKTDTPDEVESFAPHVCDHCGCELGAADLKEEYSTQEVDIIIKRQVKEVKHYSARFTLQQTGGQCPVNPVGAVQRGRIWPEHKELGAMLAHGLLPPLWQNKGSVRLDGHQSERGHYRELDQGTQETAERFVEEIERRISDSKVVNFDETGVYCMKKLDWVWIASTPKATLVFREQNRRAECLERKFGDSLTDMIAVTDRQSSYFKLGFKNNQVCLVHLLRNLQYLEDLDSKDPWPKAVARVLLDAMEERKANPGVVLSSIIYRERLDRLLERDLTGAPKAFNKLRNGIERRKDYIFTFLENPDVPPDNNSAELGFRIMKLKSNASKTFRSEWGADSFLMLHSIIQTYKKLGLTAKEAIQDVLNGLDGEAMPSAV